MNDVVIVCGGLGSRLCSIIDRRPKVLAPIGSGVFLDILLQFYWAQGFRRFILCTGYLHQHIRDYYERSCYRDALVFSEESVPLGTAGAVKHAGRLITTDTFVVANGDSYCDISIAAFIRYHRSVPDSPASVALTHKTRGSDYGQVTMGKDNRIRSFAEKVAVDPDSYVNTGIYIFDKRILDRIPDDGPYSLETQVFPDLAKTGQLTGYPVKRRVYDIGVPVRYANAKKYFEKKQ